MINTVLQAFRIVPARRLHWVLLIALAVFVSILEMVGAVIVYVLLEVVVDPAAPIELPLIGDLRDALPGVKQSTLVVAIVIGMAAFTVLRSVAKIGAKYAQYRVAHNAGARLSIRLVEGYLNLPYSIHLQRNSSELIRNAREAVMEMVRGVLIPTIKVLAELMIIVGLLVVLITIDPIATAVAVFVVGVTATALLVVVQPRLKRIGRTAHRQNQVTYKRLQQALHGLRDIRVLGREAYFVDEYGRSQMKLARTHYLRSTAGALPSVIFEAVIIGLILILFGLAIAAGAQSQSVVSLLGLFAYAGLRLQPSMQQIIGGLNEIKHASAPLDDIYADLQTIQASSTRLDGEETSRLELTESLRLEDVSYIYDGSERPALGEVNIEIRAGEQIGVCGPTGSGKTTLVDLISGLLQPSTGKVTVDGVDISDQLRAWHRNLGVVPQMVFLTDDTLRRNIALGVHDSDIDETAVDEAVGLSQLHEFLAELPDGLETRVGERGLRISGGQRQRIAIARALYRKPAVIILDEGTSALDTATEHSVMKSIDQLRGRHTVIIIAHRLTSVKNADRVIFVDGGRVAGVDTFEELERQNERFRLLTSIS